MEPAAEHIKDLLSEDSSLALTFKNNLFVGRQPSKPDFCVTVADTPGASPYLGNTKAISQYYYPTVQISVRDNNYRNAWSTAHDIMVSLHGRGNDGTVKDSTYYSLIRCSSGPTVLGYDENERVNVVVNFEIQRRPQ